MASFIPPGYLSRHSTRISQRNHTRPTSHFLWMSHNRHSTRIPQPPFHPADIPFSVDVSQPLFHLDTSAAIPPGYLSCHSTRPTSHFLWMSHSRHSTRMPQPPFHPVGIPLPRISHSRHSIRPAFHLLRIFHTRLLILDGKGEQFNFQLSLQIKMSF